MTRTHPHTRIAQVSSDDPKTAYLMACASVSKAYKALNIKPPMFDADPEFFAERITSS